MENELASPTTTIPGPNPTCDRITNESQRAAGQSPSDPGQPAHSHTQADNFPWAIFWLSVVVVIGGHMVSVEAHTLLGGELDSTPSHPALAWFFTLLAAAGLGWCARSIFLSRFAHKPALLALVGALLCGHWLALDVHHWLKALAGPYAAWAIAGVPLIILAVGLLHHWRHALETGRSLERKATVQWLAQGRVIRALVLTVSKPNCEVTIAPAPGIHARFANAKYKEDLVGNDVVAHINQLNSVKPNWQQLLRALQPHVQNLNCVYLLGSAQSRLDDAKLFLRPYLNQDQITLTPLAALKDLEDFDEVISVLREQVVKPLLKGNPARPAIEAHEIAVDITGGFKIPSVAGAVLTLNRAVVCQYVQSIGSEGEAKGELQPYIYDLAWDKSLEIP